MTQFYILEAGGLSGFFGSTYQAGYILLTLVAAFPAWHLLHPSGIAWAEQEVVTQARRSLRMGSTISGSTGQVTHHVEKLAPGGG